MLNIFFLNGVVLGFDITSSFIEPLKPKINKVTETDKPKKKKSMIPKQNIGPHTDEIG